MSRATRLPLIVAVVATLAAGIPATAEPVVPVSSNLGCDPIDPAACLLPFPNDFFTVADATTDTGRRVNFSPLAMPRGGDRGHGGRRGQADRSHRVEPQRRVLARARW